ncbi:hypothetical protein PROPHIGD11-3_49 [Mycobacterium phage prophiGD11-3]|nr:hypothetical protein PROPHIGD11-3_49 [Mycobacterium phage prophiGD11-3]QSM04600.1 hypothetical protein PROPHIGD08-3_45 [Mycobacterium phage prophiGD08-3]
MNQNPCTTTTLEQPKSLRCNAIHHAHTPKNLEAPPPPPRPDERQEFFSPGAKVCGRGFAGAGESGCAATSLVRAESLWHKGFRF